MVNAIGNSEAGRPARANTPDCYERGATAEEAGWERLANTTPQDHGADSRSTSVSGPVW